MVTPTYHRPDLLDRCLAALLAQDLDSRDYEVIIVDDAACDTTRQQVERWACKGREHGLCVRYIAATDSHGPAARNRGWQAARGDSIVYYSARFHPRSGISG